MSLVSWIAIGALVGCAAGAVFGTDYAIAGIGIGVAGGCGCFLGCQSVSAVACRSRRVARSRARSGFANAQGRAA